MDDSIPRSIDELIEQAQVIGIERKELSQFVLNQQRPDLERLTLEMEIKAMEADEIKQIREVEDKRLERKLEIKLSIHVDELYKVEMDISDLNCNIVEGNRAYNMKSLTEYNDKSDKADEAAVSEIEDKREEIENVSLNK
ncbi:reticulocyte-binding protein PFD0110w-like isoform X1 [Biomphalaria pfeifferi]|uniref:Reticulocyte-binding protein PFD0110w-like isoform X1 n=1 Tax=Biomphalaria pfeifferi TaxID=112525 RepID=A0AAD8B410_BIOPF|nr:reticulocyte-binding protein PFD0110w-like isoform X1 [Biomphalaria pfeifferi]